MKHYLIILILIFLTFTGCKEDVDVKNNPVRFGFRLLNNNGEPSTVFEKGENIVFSFLIINEGKGDLSFLQESFNTAEFLKVYENTAEGNLNAVGKPYKTIFCTYQYGDPDFSQGYPEIRNHLDTRYRWELSPFLLT